MKLYTSFLSIMEVVLDELQKNNVYIDMTTVSYHMHQCLEQYKTMYEEMATRVEAVHLPDIFNDMNVNNFGRAMAYLTLVYVLKGSENVTPGADLGFFKRQSKILGSDEVIAMTSPIR